MTLHPAELQERLQAATRDDFSVGELLGQGGFAAVFRAQDLALHRDVAIKVLDPDLSLSATLAERFLREAQTIAQLEHPHIVPIYEVEKRDGLLFIVMRFVDGPSLRALLEHGRLPSADAARIARQVADALDYAHGRGIVHRDVKPDNILLDKAGHVLVTDFGIAKAAQAATSLTAEGMVIGTPQYMSPEQAAGDEVDGRSDVYSLGIVLYQMLAGRCPFDGDSSAQILAKQLTQSPPPLEGARGDPPAALREVVLRALAKEPGKRFQTARELSRALTEAVPEAPTRPMRPPLRKRLFAMAWKSALALGAAGCLAFLAFVAGAAVVIGALLSEDPKLSARAPEIPDSVLVALRVAGAVPREESILYVFAPHGAADGEALVITHRHVIDLSSGGARRYARGSVDVRFGVTFGIRKRLRGWLGLTPAGSGPDTVFADLSPRELYELGRALATLDREDSLPRRALKP